MGTGGNWVTRENSTKVVEGVENNSNLTVLDDLRVEIWSRERLEVQGK